MPAHAHNSNNDNNNNSNNNNNNNNNKIVIMIIITAKKKAQMISTHTHIIETSREFSNFNVYFHWKFIGIYLCFV